MITPSADRSNKLTPPPSRSPISTCNQSEKNEMALQISNDTESNCKPLFM